MAFRSGEAIAWAALLLLSAGLRFAFLGARPPHHDEAIHGHFAWELLHRGSYRYDPTYHGPLQYFVLALLFAVFGESDAVLRTYAAACGVGLTAVPLVVRPLVGRGAALAMGFLLGFSPSFLYFSRFARNDVPVTLFTALALALAWRQRLTSRPLLPWAALFLALHAVSKETIYVTGVLWVIAGAALGLWFGPERSLEWVREFVRRNRKELAVAAGVFAGICVVFYTAFFTWPQDVLFPVKAIRYWYEQHLVQRVGGPWYYHLPRLGLYEFVIFGLAVTGAIRRRRRLSIPEGFALLWGVAALAMFCYLGEKVPWLAVHQILPWVFPAGVELAHVATATRRWVGKGLAALGVAGTLWSGFAASFLYPTIEPRDPHAELLVFVQTTREEEAVAQEGLELYRRDSHGIFAAVDGEGSWPLSWQWKGLPVKWALPSPGDDVPLVVADPGRLDGLKDAWGPSYACRTIPLRAWWVERWEGTSLRDVSEWFFTRRAWSERGSTDVEVCRKAERSVNGGR